MDRAGRGGGQARCAEYGAARMYVADSRDFDEYVTAQAAELLAQLVGEKSPELVLVAGTAQGKEVRQARGEDRLRGAHRRGGPAAR